MFPLSRGAREMEDQAASGRGLRGGGRVFFAQLVMNGLVVGSIYALVALGFVVIYKASSVLNFAQGEFLMLGAYVCLAVMSSTPVPFPAAFLLTLAFSVALGLFLERAVLRPMIGEPVISVIMVTLGLSAIEVYEANSRQASCEHERLGRIPHERESFLRPLQSLVGIT